MLGLETIPPRLLVALVVWLLVGRLVIFMITGLIARRMGGSFVKSLAKVAVMLPVAERYAEWRFWPLLWLRFFTQAVVWLGTWAVRVVRIHVFWPLYALGMLELSSSVQRWVKSPGTFHSTGLPAVDGRPGEFLLEHPDMVSQHLAGLM